MKSILRTCAMLVMMSLTACGPNPIAALPAPAAGMAFAQLRFVQAYELKIAPDGKRIAFVYPTGTDVAPAYGIFTAEVGGTTSRLVELTRAPHELCWAADSQSLLYFHEGRVADDKLPMPTGFSLYRLGLSGAPVLVAESVQQAGQLTIGANQDLVALRGSHRDNQVLQPIRLFQPSTGTERVASEMRTWEPTFSPDGGTIAFFEREITSSGALGESLVFYTFSSEQRRVIPMPADTAAFSQVVWKTDGQGVTVYRSNKQDQLTLQTFALDGTAEPARTVTVPSHEGTTRVDYSLISVSPDQRRVLLRRETADLKRNLRPEVIMTDGLASYVVADLGEGAIVKVLGSEVVAVGWLDEYRLLTHLEHPAFAEERVSELGRLDVVSLL